MNVASKLGRITGQAAASVARAKMASMRKQAAPGIGKALAGVGKYMLSRPIATTALGAAGLGAANEGLGYLSSNYYGKSVDNDPLWSPHLQGTRNATNSGIAGQLANFFKRPIQSIIGNQQPITNPTQAMLPFDIRRLPADMLKYTIGPDGQPRVTIAGGSVDNVPFADSFKRYMQQSKQLQDSFGKNTAPQAQSTPATTPATTPNTRYIFGPQPTLQTSATS